MLKYDSQFTELTTASYICSRHFETSDFCNYGQYKAGLSMRLKLNSGAIPSLFFPNKQTVLETDAVATSFPPSNNVNTTRMFSINNSIADKTANDVNVIVIAPQSPENTLNHENMSEILPQKTFKSVQCQCNFHMEKWLHMKNKLTQCESIRIPRLLKNAGIKTVV